MLSSKDFLEFAILSGDHFGLLLAAQAKANNRENRTQLFNFENYDNARFKVDFRFSKHDIIRLQNVLEIPDIMKMPTGQKFNGLEGKYIILTGAGK